MKISFGRKNRKTTLFWRGQALADLPRNLMSATGRASWLFLLALIFRLALLEAIDARVVLELPVMFGLMTIFRS